MEQVCNAAGQVNAAIIKDFLETNGIKASIGPDSMFSSTFGGGSSGQRYLVFVPKDKVEQALVLLKEENLIRE